MTQKLYAACAALLVAQPVASPGLAQAAKKLPAGQFPAGQSADAKSAAADWVVVPAKSSISYSGTHAGRTFTGSFSQWSAAIRFDPAKLAQANATVRIMLASSKIGDKTYDETLPGADWFDITRTPVAMFQSQRFRDVSPGKYVVDGILTLRNVKVPVSLPFSLTITGDTATMRGQVTLKRMAFGLGKSSDPSGDWVSLDIPVTVNVMATRQK